MPQLRTRVRAGPVAGLLLGIIVAFAFTMLQGAERLLDASTPRFGQPAPLTLRRPLGPRLLRDDLTGKASFRYQAQRMLVMRGTRLDPKNPVHQQLVAYDAAHRPPTWPRLAGVGLLFFLLFLGLFAYLPRFGQNRLKLLRVHLGLAAMFLAVGVTAKAFLIFTPLVAFWFPAGVIPLWVATVFDRRTAFAVTVALAVAVASLVHFDLVLLSVVLVRGTTATLFYFNRKYPNQMVGAGLFSGLSAAVVYSAIVVTFEGSFDVMGDIVDPLSSEILACVGGGLAAGLLGSLLRPPAERLLGNVPRERLLELQDLDQPLLRRLADDAPGTYEHSRAMANLAEQAAAAVGVDALLTRVGAYYHDVGKSTQCKYFVENLGPDERSPHEELDPEASAKTIMSHVVDGARLARDGGIPEPVVEFCYTHHGNQLVEYFWNKCQQLGNPKGLTEDVFRYPGMRPQTKETAIVMLVDSIEAASRTVDPPAKDEFEAMVQRVVYTKLNSGQLDDSGLEMRDLRIISTRVVKALVNMHHHRIKYQWQVQKAEQFGVPSRAVRPSVPDYDPVEAEAPDRPSRLDLTSTLPETAIADGAASVAPTAPEAEAPAVEPLPPGGAAAGDTLMPPALAGAEASDDEAPTSTSS